MKAITILVSLTVVTILSCNTNTGKTSSRSKDFIENIVDIAINNRDNKTIELPLIYDTLVSQVSADSNETLILAESLKRRGFKVIDWGRGNYPPRGHRIVTLTLQKDDCICQVDKIYYFTTSDTLFQMSERIKCRDIGEHKY